MTGRRAHEKKRSAGIAGAPSSVEVCVPALPIRLRVLSLALRPRLRSVAGLTVRCLALRGSVSGSVHRTVRTDRLAHGRAELRQLPWVEHGTDLCEQLLACHRIRRLARETELMHRVADLQLLGRRKRERAERHAHAREMVLRCLWDRLAIGAELRRARAGGPALLVLIRRNVATGRRRSLRLLRGSAGRRHEQRPGEGEGRKNEAVEHEGLPFGQCL